MRLDKYLVENGVVISRSKAVHLIKAGKIRINGQLVYKQSYNVKNNDKVEIIEKYKYIGRGGYKIEEFIKANIEKNIIESNFIKNKNILDIGCSVGGFSDFFLKSGANKVVGIDISKEIIAKSLLSNLKFKFYGGIDVLNKKALDQKFKEDKFDVISIDVSNINLLNILRIVKDYVAENGIIIALFKPQYEKTDATDFKRKTLTKEIIDFLSENFETQIKNSFEIIGKEYSKFRGTSKNKGVQEIFYMLKKKK
ncbi:MAG: SAM-dependent methyltransferase [Promethearchaeota archaeon]